MGEQNKGLHQFLYNFNDYGYLLKLRTNFIRKEAKWNIYLMFQRVQDAEAVLADDNQLVTEMTTEQLQCLDLITSTQDVLLQEFEEKFLELKEDIGQVKVIKIFLNFSFPSI